MMQVFEAEQSFLIHHANAFEDGDEVEVWSSGWGPEALKRLASGAGMLGSWKVVLEGDFSWHPLYSSLEAQVSLEALSSETGGCDSATRLG